MPARGRDTQQAPQRRPPDVIELLDDDEVQIIPRTPIDGVQLIGSPARARAQGINKSLRNYKTTERWRESQRKEQRRLEMRKQGAVDLTHDDDDDDESGPSRRSYTRGPGMQSQSAMDVDRRYAGGSVLEAIEISDDEDPEVPGSPMLVSPPPEPAVEHEPAASDSEDSEDSWFALDFDDPEVDPMDVTETVVPSVDKGKQRATIEKPIADYSPPQRWRQHEMHRYDTPGLRSHTKKRKQRLWDVQCYDPPSYNHLTPTTRHRHSMFSLACHKTTLFSGVIPRTTDILCTQLTVSRLRQSGLYQKTSGQVNKVAQSNGIVAIASATLGGERDEDMTQPPEIDPYNCKGNLVFWTGDTFVSSDSHSQEWPSEDDSGRIEKFYTINDVAFDPQDDRTMVSAGKDCCVRVWDISKFRNNINGSNQLNMKEDVQSVMQLPYKDDVNDIQFRPGAGTTEPLVAISCFDGWIHFIEGLAANRRFMLEVASGASADLQKMGAFLWGTRVTEAGVISSNSLLFASTEAPDELGLKCRHVCFHVARKQALYEFPTTESGDAMALDSQGRTLALVTSTSTHRTLALYDVTSTRSAGRSPMTSLHLPPSTITDVWEVNTAQFSQDDVLLALGTSDDRVLIYDTRFMGKNDSRGGPCLTYDLGRGRHSSGDNFGVTGLEWVPGYYGGRGLGLLTGGSDGCVRLWDVGQGHKPEDFSVVDGVWNPENVITIGNHGVGCLSVGHNQREHRLVVGDIGGDVYILD